MPVHNRRVIDTPMKSLLSITVAMFALTSALLADESKKTAPAKDACCEEKPKAGQCSSAKEAAQRQALLTHKGAHLARR